LNSKKKQRISKVNESGDGALLIGIENSYNSYGGNENKISARKSGAI
jgi:hypothetical protein